MYDNSSTRGDMLPMDKEADWKKLAEQLMAQMQEISDVLRISEDDQATASGHSAIILAIAELRRRPSRMKDHWIAPIKPTSSMLDDGCEAIQGDVENTSLNSWTTSYSGTTRGTAQAAWEAMLAAWQRDML